MELSEKYRLSEYQDYGPLGEKEHVHLLRHRCSGKICVKKYLEPALKDVVNFRKNSDSPYFPKLLEVMEAEGKMLLIEEYVEGVTLEEYMMGQALTEKTAVCFARQICEALGCLHSASPMIVYRDLKPENIMVTPAEEIRLIDFHISRNYQEGKKRDTVLMGTAEYAAPEQFGYFQTDNRTDIYAFGVVFNYMLTGKFPIQQMAEGRYGKMIRKCLELEPGRRYQKVEEILRELPQREKADGDVMQKMETLAAGSWKIPGFRSGKIWKKMLALLGYGFILWMGLNCEFKSADGVPYGAAQQWLNRIMITAAQIGTVFFCADYRGISAEIRFYKSRFWPVRLLAYGVTWLVFMVGAVILTAIAETLLPI